MAPQADYSSLQMVLHKGCVNWGGIRCGRSNNGSLFYMDQFWPWENDEQMLLYSGFGQVQGSPNVRKAVKVTTTVESLSSARPEWEVAGMLSQDSVQKDELQDTGTPTYFVYAHKAISGMCWRPNSWGPDLREFPCVSIPKYVDELCDRCFKGCVPLSGVTLVSSSSLERIGISCFEICGVEAVTIPDSVRELGDRCFRLCRHLRRVTFGSLSSVERIGVSCFAGSVVEEVSIPNSVRELCDQCFHHCWCLRRVTFGSLSSLERIGMECFAECPLIEFEVPGAVGVIAGGAFGECELSGGLVCRNGYRFHAFDGLIVSHDCERCFCSYGVLSSICIPDSVRELCDRCFQGCKSLRRVVFGSSSSLERIGRYCFADTAIEEVSIPNCVNELCGGCFKRCKSLRRVMFSSLSSLERLGVSCLAHTAVEELRIPDCVHELCDRCFKGCESLRRVTFGSSSSLERIGVYCFGWSGVEEVSIPDSVRELCDLCFRGCRGLRQVTFGSSSSLERIGVEAFGAVRDQRGDHISCAFVAISIPDSVRELCDGCFKGCNNLRRVTFGDSSSLERIGVSCFKGTDVREVIIPDSVRELCDGCFKGCMALRRVKFGFSSSLERIGVEAFGAVLDRWGDHISCNLVTIFIPNSVRELGDRCFQGCRRLRRVMFGSSSSLERIGVQCFDGCCL